MNLKFMYEPEKFDVVLTKKALKWWSDINLINLQWNPKKGYPSDYMGLTVWTFFSY